MFIVNILTKTTDVHNEQDICATKEKANVHYEHLLYGKENLIT